MRGAGAGGMGRQLKSEPIALLGIGKIARDQHIPAIARSDAFHLTATVSRSGGVDGVENHTDIAALLAARPDIGVVSLCMPPVPRFDIAMAALAAGKHVMLEKPPGATVSEVHKLERLARAKGVTLFATWHSRHAAGVARARAHLRDARITHVQIDWREDVRRWHPGQDWIWQAGGLGVFDPGINALSIMTAVLPQPVHLTAATLAFPANRDTPIAADLVFAGAAGLRVDAAFDWRQEGPQSWTITVQTTDGELRLTDGGATLHIDGVLQTVAGIGEYPGLYHRFAELIEAGQSDVDTSPLAHVADAFLLGRRTTVAAFHD
ncbi:D-galactose 1-dehydrogenase [Loktanella fryxellensis]|uniref:D-galactose 1-dehydrogenase n=1 Tax=Loktanella fryxellensis TaxID=245187 RepID=A0A1H8IYB3_9RHOB|nr:Gfo/Idh/MocA family oxidoreductase [Loktanella fryxellensis]SEN73165.1 D-galactose 1-dehydrogenase [Loktanella fryxellensis]